MARPNRHPHRIAVFAYDSNPKIDKPILRKSEAYVMELLLSGSAERCGLDAVRLLPTREQAADMRHHKALAEDWRVRPSGLPLIGYHFVMQLVTR